MHSVLTLLVASLVPANKAILEMELLAQVQYSLNMHALKLFPTISDINECTLNTDNCNANAACADTEGSFTCTCNPGYEGDGVTCTSTYKCIQIVSL